MGGPSSDPPSWDQLRQLFPATRDAAYLNTAAYGPGPTPVVDATREHLEAWTHGTGSWLDWEATAEDARRLFAELVGAQTDTIALVSSMSGAAAQVAHGLPDPPRTGANLVVGEQEFRSNLFPWLNLEGKGYEVRLVPFRGGRITAGDLASAMDGRTALVAVSHVQSANGYRVDLPALAQACRDRDARLFVDATQSTGALRVPIEGVDYLAAIAYKWMLSPRGSAFLYVAPHRLGEQRPLVPSWKSPSEPYKSYYGPPYEPADRASGLDTSLAWPVWPGTATALRMLLDIGLDAIEARDLELAGRFCDGLPALGLQPLFDGPERSQIVSLRVPDPDAVQRALQGEGVVAAVRGEYLRTAFHFFNDESDVDRALTALGSVVA
ncbi:MAG: aminotransferase class V-fold PLP-dependent enzyme [Acidobacteriota bacterium]